MSFSTHKNKSRKINIKGEFMYRLMEWRLGLFLKLDLKNNLVIASPGFDDFEHLVILIFLLMDHFSANFLHVLYK